MADTIAEVGVAQLSGSETAATTFSAVKPTGAAAGNLLVAVVACPGNRTITPPAGWTLMPNMSWLTSAASGGDQRVEVYTAAGDVAALAFTFSTSTRARIHTRCFSGVDPQLSNAYARNLYTSTVTSIVAPDATPNVPGTVALWAFGLNPNGSGSTITLADARLTDIANGGASINACLATGIAVAAGTDDHTGPGTLTATASLAGKAAGGVVMLWPNGARQNLTLDTADLLVMGPRLATPYNAASALLSWRPPVTTGYTVVHVSDANRSLTLDNSTDYLIVFDSKITAISGLAIVGGRNVVIIGGEIDASGLAAGRLSAQMRGLYLNGQTGDVFVEGLWIHGAVSTGGTAGALGDGIDVNAVTSSSRKTSVTLQNLRIDNVRADASDQQIGAGAYAANEMHPDVVQIYGVVQNCDIRMDKITADSTYQGLFCQSVPPNGSAIKDYRRIDIDGAPTYDGATQVSAYLLYNSFGADAGRVACQDVVLRKNAGRTDAQVVDPMSKNFGYDGMVIQTGAIAVHNVAAGGVGTNPGMGYVTPGYQPIP